MFFFGYKISLTHAQVVINEVLPNPVGDDSGAELIELYSKTDSPLSLDGCILYFHETDNYQKVVFNAGDFIDKYKVISSGGEWIRNTGDQIRLICTSFNDSVSFGDMTDSVVAAPNEGLTFGRSPDGTGGFYLLSSETMTNGGSSNSSPISQFPLGS